MKQLNLFPVKRTTQFGGSKLIGKRKTARPLSTRKPIHLILKATNAYTLLKNRAEVERVLFIFAKRMGVKIYDCAVHADHIHLSIQILNRTQYVRWIRAAASMLVQKFHGLKWKLRPYTRVTEWGRAFQVLKNYIWKNREEGKLIAYAENRVKNYRIRLLTSAWSAYR